MFDVLNAIIVPCKLMLDGHVYISINQIATFADRVSARSEPNERALYWCHYKIIIYRQFNVRFDDL